MSIILFEPELEATMAFEQFLTNLRSATLNYLASDLLENGLSPNDINDAIQRATLVCKTGGKEIRNHFLPVYSSHRGQLVKDCKLSKLGYALVLMNARADNQAMAEWQLELLERIV